MKACLFAGLLMVAAPSVALADDATKNDSGGAAPEQRNTAAPPTSVPRRTVGQVLTIVGIAQLVVGAAVTAVYAVETAPGPPNSIDGGCRACFPPFPFFVGPAILVSGVISSAVGIPLWITGALPARTASERLSSPALVPRLGIGPASATFALSF